MALMVPSSYNESLSKWIPRAMAILRQAGCTSGSNLPDLTDGSVGRVLVTPHAKDNNSLHPEEFQPATAFIKTLSVKEISFFHKRAIPRHRVRIRFEYPSVFDFTVLTLLRWYYSVNDTWFLSGGTLVQILTDNPIEPKVQIPPKHFPSSVAERKHSSSTS